MEIVTSSPHHEVKDSRTFAAFVTGTLALGSALLLVRMFSLETVKRTLGACHNLTSSTQVPATEDEVARWRNALPVKMAKYLTRVACLETSVALALMAAWRGKRLLWCIGATTSPFYAHAWVAHAETGEPLGELPFVKSDVLPFFKV